MEKLRLSSYYSRLSKPVNDYKIEWNVINQTISSSIALHLEWAALNAEENKQFLMVDLVNVILWR